MNPAVVFKDLADISLSVILTSGTLSPMNSFSSELGMQFGTSLEAPHVIDPNMQVLTKALHLATVSRIECMI
jgi:Fanconi anemia group J protein